MSSVLRIDIYTGYGMDLVSFPRRRDTYKPLGVSAGEAGFNVLRILQGPSLAKQFKTPPPGINECWR